MKTVILSHGKESGPKGTKIQILSRIAKENGFHPISIDYRSCKDAEERVELLKQSISDIAYTELVLVGSSMGGYVSITVANEIEVKGLFLMCPALYLPNYEVQEYNVLTNNIEIIHGWQDDIVPYEHSVRFGKKNLANVHLVSDNHRLSGSHLFLSQIFANFLKRL
jgi:surfactin synthase thioesterase subunit